MKKILLNFINPVKLFKAWVYKRNSAKYDKSAFDLELYLYSKILRNDMLHYGYFDNPNVEPDTISIRDFELAQIKYAENIISQIPVESQSVLDVGCGMGGLSNLISQKGLKVEALTPNQEQIRHITQKYPLVTCHNCKFEDFDQSKKFDTIINSESLQYISLDEAFKKVKNLLNPHGVWIICDYFRLNNTGRNKSSHLLADFLKKIEDEGWTITYQSNITPNILPTLNLVSMYAERFMLPATHFGFEKLRFKKPGLYYLIQDVKDKVFAKIDKELAGVDPKKFKNEKQYMLFVLRP